MEESKLAGKEASSEGKKIIKSEGKDFDEFPALVFNSRGMSPEKFSDIIKNSLNLCCSPKIKKFGILTHFPLSDLTTAQLTEWLREIMVKNVEEISLDSLDAEYWFQMPQFAFNYEFLVAFRIQSSILSPEGKVNWSALKSLTMEDVVLTNQSISHILSGTPFLESLEFYHCLGFNKLVLVSEYLKQFVLYFSDDAGFDLHISSPKLQTLSFISEVGFKSVRLGDLSSCVTAVLHFWVEDGHNYLDFVKEWFLQLRNAEELDFGPWLFMMLSYGEVLVDPLVSWNCKRLSLIDPFLETKRPGLQSLLPSFPKLEELVIELDYVFECEDFVLTSKKLPNSSISLSHLKTVKIHPLHLSYGRQNPMIEFLEFLLKNGSGLEKIIVHVIPDIIEVLPEEERISTADLFLRLLRAPKSSTHGDVVKMFRF